MGTRAKTYRPDFHFLDGKTGEPVCGAPAEAQPTENVESSHRCPACAKIVEARLGK